MIYSLAIRKLLSSVVVISLMFSCIPYFQPKQASAAWINLGYGKSTIVSTSENTTNTGPKAVDGNGSTKWVSTALDNQYIIVDLGSQQSITNLQLKWDTGYAKQYQVQTSNDNVNWITVYENYNGTGGNNSISLNNTVNARYVKMYGIQRAISSIGFGLFEFEIYGLDVNIAYGKPATDATTGTTTTSVTDGNGTTKWVSSNADNQSLIIDLGSTQTIARAALKWGSTYASQFQILKSTDNINWTQLYSNYNATGGDFYIDFASGSARYVKLYVIKRAGSAGASVAELELFANNGSTKQTVAVLDYFKGSGRSGTIIGEHNREINTAVNGAGATSSYYTDKIYDITGTYPAFWSGDFLFSSEDVNNRQKMIDEAKRQWENGAIIQLMLHVTPPTTTEVGTWEGNKNSVTGYLTNEEWSSLLTNGQALNNAWKSRLDIYASYIQQLKNSNIPVLFRPFHEMNQEMFWWSGRNALQTSSRNSVPQDTAALYRLTRDYLVNTKGLTNIIWVWDVQDLAPPSGKTFAQDWSSYNPGDSYWDILAVDIYEGLSMEKYNAALSVAGTKPIAIGEFDKLPTASQLASMPRWAFAMGWSELVYAPVASNNNQALNTYDEIRSFYNAPNVITRKALPKLK